METHLSLLDGLSAELPEDPILDGKIAFLTAPKSASRRNGGGAGAPAPAHFELADTAPSAAHAAGHEAGGA